MASPLVDKGHSVFRDWFRKVWEVRGGGLYACGFAATFLILEIRALGEDVAAAGSIFTGGAFGFLIDFFIDSLMNTFQALIWPIFVVLWAPPWGAIGLGLAYVGFANYLKKPITDWLFDGGPDPTEKAKKGE
jgi:hypothetical protein